jgi:ABC-type uncharacterized transport system permease subunit
MLHLLIIISLLGYLLSAGFYLLSLVPKRGDLAKIATGALWGAFVSQTLSIVLLAANESFTALYNSGDFYFLLSWLLTLLYCFMGRKIRYSTIGACIAGTASLLVVSSSLVVHMEGATPAASELNYLTVALHVVPALIAEAFLLFAFVLSALYLLQERRLKKKSLDLTRPAGPSLEILDTLAKRFVFWGFIAMSIALGSGTIWAFSAHRALLRGDLLLWSAFVSWVLLAVILHATRHLYWSHRKIATLTASAVGLFFISLTLILITSGSSFHAVR